MHLIYILAGILSFSGSPVQEQGNLTKKEEKFLKEIYPTDVWAQGISVSAIDTSIIVFMREGDQIYRVRQEDQLMGYLLSTRAPGRYEDFDYLLAYTADLAILGVKVTNYRSSHGAAICQKRWLSQFVGHTGESLSLGKDIDAVGGATISASSLVLDLNRCYQLLQGLKESDLAD
jgi:Na+-translocating ferredoxin:NAD+ oxidoreductase RnfG subunit